MCELLLNSGAELKVLDLARRSPEMLARRNEHYEVLSVIAKFHESTDDEDAPLLVFKPFSGVMHSATKPEGMADMDITPNDFKFDLSPE
jgi:hypothetical protein